MYKVNTGIQKKEALRGFGQNCYRKRLFLQFNKQKRSTLTEPLIFLEGDSRHQLANSVSSPASVSSDTLLGELKHDASLVFVKRLFLSKKSSLDGGAGFAAIFGAINAGSLSFKETCLATRPTSSFRKCSILAISMGMYSYFFLVFTTFESHSFVR